MALLHYTIASKPHRENKQFSTRVLASTWIENRLKEIEHASVHGEKNNLPIKAVIADYQQQFSQNYGRSKNYDLARLLKYPSDCGAMKKVARYAGTF